MLTDLRKPEANILVITFHGNVYTIQLPVLVTVCVQSALSISSINSFPFSSLVSLFELQWSCHFKSHCTLKKNLLADLQLGLHDLSSLRLKLNLIQYSYFTIQYFTQPILHGCQVKWPLIGT